MNDIGKMFRRNNWHPGLKQVRPKWHVYVGSHIGTEGDLVLDAICGYALRAEGGASTWTMEDWVDDKAARCTRCDRKLD